jgi:hypothetical protein
MHTADDVARIAQHGDDVKVAIKPQAGTHNVEITWILRQIDADIAPVRRKRRFVPDEGIDLEAGSHAFGNESRAGTGADTNDVDPFHSAPHES